MPYFETFQPARHNTPPRHPRYTLSAVPNNLHPGGPATVNHGFAPGRDCNSPQRNDGPRRSFE